MPLSVKNFSLLLVAADIGVDPKASKEITTSRLLSGPVLLNG